MINSNKTNHRSKPIALDDDAVDVVAADGVDGLLDAVVLADGQVPPGLPVPVLLEGVGLVVLEVPVRRGAAALELVPQVLAPLAHHVVVVVGPVDGVAVPEVDRGLHVDAAGPRLALRVGGAGAAGGGSGGRGSQAG
ncbi:hypothetical protein PG988_012019 [Apiospora saccharicola]